MEKQQHEPKEEAEVGRLEGLWEEASVQELYRTIDENANVTQFQLDGKTMTALGPDLGNCLFLIEKFMHEVSARIAAFSEEISPRGHLKPLGLAKYLGQMKAFLSVHSMGKVYSPRVDLFYATCVTKYGLHAEDFTGYPDAFNPAFQMKEGRFFNKLINELRAAMCTRSFKRKLYARKEAVKLGKDSSAEYIEAMFAKTSRLLVLRIDFGFRTPDPMKEHPVGLTEAQTHMAKFLNNKRGKALYKNMKGYIWRLEYGLLKGYHYHVIFFFNGAYVHKDGYLANEIGADWNRVTGGQGIFYNCNSHKQAYKRVGIGMISHDDETMRRNLLDVVAYMHKEDQTLREKHTDKTRCWSRGTLPEARSSNSGRPRRVKPCV